MDEIITERLILRCHQPEDWENSFEYLSDPEVLQYEPYRVYTKEECQREVLRRSTDLAFLAVCLKTEQKLIGNLYFKEQEEGTWELGYVFNRKYQKLGYATEAAMALLDLYFRTGKARRVIAMCNPNNENSWRLLERLKLRREGHFLKNVYFWKDENGNPIWQDTYEYAILAEEWKLS